MKEILKMHGAKVVSAPAKATHIIYPTPASGAEEDLDYLRTIDKREKTSLVHWWYYPDSYDTWIPSTDVEGEAEQDEDRISDLEMKIS